MARSRAPSVLTLLFAAATLASARQAPQGQFQQVQGGFIPWVWVSKDPSQPGEHLVWTAEDGARIRYSEVVGGVRTWVFQPHAPAIHRKTYRHILIDEVPFGDLVGVAVGEGGQLSWSTNPASPDAIWRDEYPSWGQGVDLWESYFDLDTSFPGGWVVGSGGLFEAIHIDGTPVGVEMEFPFDPAPSSLGLTLRGVGFVPGETVGAIVGDMKSGSTQGSIEGLIYHSIDGRSWYQASITIDCFPLDPRLGINFDMLSLYDVVFVPGSYEGPGTGVGYAVGGIPDKAGPGIVLRTEDGGATWTQEHHECIDPITCDLSFECQAPDDECAPYVAPCSSTQRVNLDTGGKAFGTLYGVSVFGDNVGAHEAIAVGYGSQVVRRPRDSTTWEDLGDACTYLNIPLWGVHGSADEPLVFVSGMFNRLVELTDAGATLLASHGWDKDWRLRTTTFISPGVGWAAGQLNRIARTDDGGVTWTEQYVDFGVAGSLNGLAFASGGQNGVAVGAPTASGFNLLWTDQGVGSCWFPRDCVTLESSCDDASPICAGASSVVLTDVSFSGMHPTDGNEFWAVGTQNTILYSKDGGRCWQSVVPEDGPEEARWNAISFWNRDTGVLVGWVPDSGAGLVFQLQDATSAPRLVDLTPPGAPRLRDVALAQSKGYVVGDHGLVYRYDVQTNSFLIDTDAAGLTNENLLSVGLVMDGQKPLVLAGGAKGVMIQRHPEIAPHKWSLVHSRTSSNLTGLSFPTPGRAFALGQDSGDQTTIVRYE